MNIPRLVKWQLKDAAKHVVWVWAISVLFHQTVEWREAHLHKVEIAALAAEHFDDYMVYHSIFPPIENVAYGDIVRYVSDAEILKGGFRIEWEETIECDHNPYDGKRVFEWYANVKTTGRTMTKPRKRSTPEELESKKGFVVHYRGTDTPIRYPDHDADCRLETVMTQHHKYGIEKIQTRYSDIARVRGVHE